MKQFLLIFLAFNLLAADKEVGKSKPKVGKSRQTQTKGSANTPDPEDQWMCRIGSYHGCSCPAMVSEHWEEVNNKCSIVMQTGDKFAYRKCLQENEMNPCAIIQKADTQHPAHTCKRTCSRSRCLCNDGPKCFGPSLLEEGNEDR